MNIYFFRCWRVRSPRIKCWQACAVPDKCLFLGLWVVICLVVFPRGKAQVVETSFLGSLVTDASFLSPPLCPFPQALESLVSIQKIKAMPKSLECWHHTVWVCWLCLQVFTGILFLMKLYFPVYDLKIFLKSLFSLLLKKLICAYDIHHSHGFL